ncbi:3-oxoacyl-[acyl-carrier-protein] synthase III C-terminal domain-containing protein [Mycobacterium haemophilum]|uniref:3-oxoacyl-[acyl-carrier-protein] synthase III C-terminal domain-containing protein n=1 Tax=Mycobacterium haemophilum TaxID=29311 RepID=UPI0009E44D64|nr:3-oxoacyl-[acyl-carrier-protein] synthase III C-terminal domain-containing protein [Mycobacterium haemophilum]
MGTIIKRLNITSGSWRTRHSALHLAVTAAQKCLQGAEQDPNDVDLLVNAGIYRERNLGEPALAALIQEDIGANVEDPHAGAHGTFSFDIANGTCGVLTALQVVDGFLRSHTVDCALIVASDVDPGHGMSEHFPFAPVGAALLCGRTGDGDGLGQFHWANLPDDGENFRATIGLGDARNVLRFNGSVKKEQQFATAAAEAAHGCLAKSALGLDKVDAIVAAPALAGYRTELATQLGVPVERITIAADEKIHTASLVAALDRCTGRFPAGAQVLLIVAGAGITAGAALYRQPLESSRQELNGLSAHQASGVLPFRPHSLCPHDRSTS